jgi:hypothetical protein
MKKPRKARPRPQNKTYKNTTLNPWNMDPTLSSSLSSGEEEREDQKVCALSYLAFTEL